jgi:hypothetical protein
MNEGTPEAKSAQQSVIQPHRETAGSEPPAVTPWVSLRDWIDVGAKVSFGALTGCYAAGLIIVNAYLRQYNLTQFGLLQVEYVVTGGVWLFLVAFATFSAKYVWHRASVAVAEWRAGGRRFLPGVSALITIVVLPTTFFLGLSLLTDGQLYLFSWKGPLVGLSLAFQGGVAIVLLRDVRMVVRKVKDKSIMTEKDQATANNVLGGLLIFVVFLGTYAQLVYPAVSPTFGGGKQLTVSLVFKAEQVPLMRSLGFTVSQERVTTPLMLILETPDFLLLAPPTQNDRSFDLKAIKIRRDTVDTILYLEPKDRRARSIQAAERRNQNSEAPRQSREHATPNQSQGPETEAPRR